jgi:hypothetical protein
VAAPHAAESTTRTLRAIRVLLTAVAAAGAAWYVMAELRTGPAGFPIDDGWIHAQFARNLAMGHGMAFNPGEPSTGTTSPLWTWLLAIPVALGMGVVPAAKVLGTSLAALAAVLAFELTRTVARSLTAGIVAGLATALSPRLTWGAVSGMEVPLYCALVCATLVVFVRTNGRRGWDWATLAGLATLARPETGVLFPVLLAVALFRRPASMDPTDATVIVEVAGRGMRRRTRPLLLAALCFGGIVGAVMILNVYVSGRPLPATFYAKAEARGLVDAVVTLDSRAVSEALVARPLATLNQVVRYVAEQSLVLFLFALAGVLYLAGVMRRRRDEPAVSPAALAVPALLVAAPLAMGAFAPVSPLLMQEGRYVAHLLIVSFVLSATGAAILARQVRYPTVVWAFALLAVARLASQDIAFAGRYALQVENINRMHVAAGRWVASHTSADAVVATNDIGAIAFFSNRRVLDLEGLTTPAMLPFKAERRQLEYVVGARPDLLIMFDEWYPRIAARTDLFAEIHRITVPRVTAAHDTLKVYRTPWTDALIEDAPVPSSSAP